MGTPDNKLSEVAGVVKSWISRRSEPTNLSRDFWMPDQSCRVCYECDSYFTLFNRRHHCRVCGLVFCAKCAANTVKLPSDEPRTGREDCERIRVCSYCFKQWEQGIEAADDGINKAQTPQLSPSPSVTSLVSIKSSCTCDSSTGTVGSNSYSTGAYQLVSYTCDSPRQCRPMDPISAEQENIELGRSTNPDTSNSVDSAPHQFGSCTNRSDDEDDEHCTYQSNSETGHYPETSGYYAAVSIGEVGHAFGPQERHPVGENMNSNSLSCSQLSENSDRLEANRAEELEEEAHESNISDDCENNVDSRDYEPLDFENDRLLWIPPEPEDEVDEREPDLFDDDDDDDGEGTTGEWGYLRSTNGFDSDEFRSKDNTSEEHRKAMKNVVDGHFRALIAQLLQVENLSAGDEDDKENWLEIVTSLSWAAATLLKPDTSKDGGMDPGGYVKVKCIACGCRSESTVVKGVVCKKNVAHRRMTSKIDKPRFLVLGGALEYQRIANHLSSVDTLLQQEMDHLKMAVAKIDAYHPNVLLVEKSVSRYAQEYLLAKDISLVLNIKRPLLERIARCTGAQIVPSIDHLASHKLGYCDTFRVEKFVEEHGSAGQGGKKGTKTLMFFDGCPKPLGCTILLKGASGDELKKVKHVVQYGVFAAYHLALETSFLADEGASLPKLPLKSPITVALPDKPSSLDRSISTIPGFTLAGSEKSSLCPEPMTELQNSDRVLDSDKSSTANVDITSKPGVDSTSRDCSQTMDLQPSLTTIKDHASSVLLFTSEKDPSYSYLSESSSKEASDKENKMNPEESVEAKTANMAITRAGNHAISNIFYTSDASKQVRRCNSIDDNNLGNSEFVSFKRGSTNKEEMGSLTDEFPPSPSDHQSILVSLSARCVYKGTVCERAHLFRIKYYGSFDKPLGRFLRDHLFNQNYRCQSCDLPSEAHVYCYTHRQGSLTISVTRLQEHLLPGEREGKIWMWHRCLRCPRTNGFPPATRRVVMSDAAWGLSFGKFLELSFSNHAAASRVASCGHSLHRDCLRFYGFGKMVACFRYAAIDIHSVYLPPPKLGFDHENQEWIHEEADEVRNKIELLFAEVCNALHQISEKSGAVLEDKPMKTAKSRVTIPDLKEKIQKIKEELEESLQAALDKGVKVGQPSIDILKINKLRRQIIIYSYAWDRILIDASSSHRSNVDSMNSPIPTVKEKTVSSVEKLVEANMASKRAKSFSSSESIASEAKLDMHHHQGGIPNDIHKENGVHKEMGMDGDLSPKNEAEHVLSSSESANGKPARLDSGKALRNAVSDGEYPVVADISDTLDAAWSGKNPPASIANRENGYSFRDPTCSDSSIVVNPVASGIMEQGEGGMARSVSSLSSSKATHCTECSKSSVGVLLPNLPDSFNARKLAGSEYNPSYVLSLKEVERQSSARLLLPVGINDTIVPVYDDEPTSIISYVLLSLDYARLMSASGGPKDATESAFSTSLSDSANLFSTNSFDNNSSDSYRSLGSTDESFLSTSGSRGWLVQDPLSYTKDFHARIQFNDDVGKVKYTVTCYYAKSFDALRRMCCPSELDFIRSLSRCKKWGAQGGKSNVFFAKTLDERFIIKQVTKTELESFIKFGPAYFKYLSESISMGSPTCLAKILGIYQVSSKHLKGGKETKMDVLVMENLLFKRNVTRVYDLKGSARSRYNPDASGSNKVLLDQNLIEAMPTSPIFVGSKAKRLLERAVWNDTAFLSSIDVMDYSLLVGVDEEKHELVLGIIDFMRQYTWDKHLETWVKTTGILGGAKNTSPTVISPQQYKKRFRKAMTTYFLMVPDQWFPPMVIHSGSQSDFAEENQQGQGVGAAG